MSDEIIKNEQATDIAGPRFSFDLTKEGNRKAAVNAMSNAEALSEYVEVPLNIRGVIQQPGVRKSRNANLPDAPCINTYLVATDGKAYFSQSDGIARSVAAIMTFCGDISEGIEVIVHEKQLKNGNSLKVLEMM